MKKRSYVQLEKDRDAVLSAMVRHIVLYYTGSDGLDYVTDYLRDLMTALLKIDRDLRKATK